MTHSLYSHWVVYHAAFSALTWDLSTAWPLFWQADITQAIYHTIKVCIVFVVKGFHQIQKKTHRNGVRVKNVHHHNISLDRNACIILNFIIWSELFSLNRCLDTTHSDSSYTKPLLFFLLFSTVFFPFLSVPFYCPPVASHIISYFQISNNLHDSIHKKRLWLGLEAGLLFVPFYTTEMLNSQLWLVRC